MTISWHDFVGVYSAVLQSILSEEEAGSGTNQGAAGSAVVQVLPNSNINFKVHFYLIYRYLFDYLFLHEVRNVWSVITENLATSNIVINMAAWREMHLLTHQYLRHPGEAFHFIHWFLAF